MLIATLRAPHCGLSSAPSTRMWPSQRETPAFASVPQGVSIILLIAPESGDSSPFFLSFFVVLLISAPYRNLFPPPSVLSLFSAPLKGLRDFSHSLNNDKTTKRQAIRKKTAPRKGSEQILSHPIYSDRGGPASGHSPTLRYTVIVHHNNEEASKKRWESQTKSTTITRRT
jgi:hypothetical protein